MTPSGHHLSSVADLILASVTKKKYPHGLQLQISNKWQVRFVLLLTRPCILIFLIFQGRVVEDASITASVDQLKVRRAHSCQFLAEVLMTLLSSTLSKNANDGLPTHTDVRAYGHIAL